MKRNQQKLSMSFLGNPRRSLEGRKYRWMFEQDGTAKPDQPRDITRGSNLSNPEGWSMQRWQRDERAA